MDRTYIMTGMLLHGIVDVRIERHQQDSGTYVIEVTAKDSDGHRTEITMFSKDKVDITYDNKE